MSDGEKEKNRVPVASGRSSSQCKAVYETLLFVTRGLPALNYLSDGRFISIANNNYPLQIIIKLSLPSSEFVFVADNDLTRQGGRWIFRLMVWSLSEGTSPVFFVPFSKRP